MYKLMVVDDEFNTRDGLQHAIPWDSIGVEVVGSAVDGVDALKKLSLFQPDIIITDVKMDRMDGLSMAGEIAAQYPFVKFIVLSGYDDPKYIRRSMNLKVFSYLLKPVEEEELLSAVKQQIFEIEKEKQLREKIEILDRELDGNSAAQIDKLLADMIAGNVGQELSSRAEKLREAMRRPVTPWEAQDQGHIKNMIIRANRHLAANYGDREMSLMAMADFLRLNPSYFSRIYKKETGVSFVEAMTMLRMERAKAMLADPEKKIAEIAGAVGYDSTGYFCTIFKKYNGMSPTHFRERRARI